MLEEGGGEKKNIYMENNILYERLGLSSGLSLTIIIRVVARDWAFGYVAWNSGRFHKLSVGWAWVVAKDA